MRIGKCGAHTRQEKANPLRMKGGPRNARVSREISLTGITDKRAEGGAWVRSPSQRSRACFFDGAGSPWGPREDADTATGAGDGVSGSFSILTLLTRFFSTSTTV